MSLFLKRDITEAIWSLQLCAGQEAGCEAAVHAMRELFCDMGNDAVLLVDANNAFNLQTALHNIRVLCPTLSTILINTYRAPVHLFITGGEHMLSQEGTTQGDPLAMAMYALGLQPLITLLHGLTRQVSYADDATGAGSLAEVKCWDAMVMSGPQFGYDVNPRKTWLIVKEEAYNLAVQLFSGTGVQITSKGK